MAKRLVRSLILLALALLVVPFLPLYLERTLTRSWRVDRVGDEIQWGWRLVSLRDYWSEYHYMTREQQPALWLKLDIALAFVYALAFAFLVDQLLNRLNKRRTKSIGN